MNILGLNFLGPFWTLRSILNLPGIYVVLQSYNGGYRCLDVGETGELNARLATHDRRSKWQVHLNGMSPSYAVLYLPNSNAIYRRSIEGRLRSALKPMCGER